MSTVVTPDGKPTAKPKAAPRKAPAKKVAAPKQDLASFARQVLAGLGYPTTSANVNFIVAWANREGGGGAFNPLNTTQSESGSSPLTGNSAGVQNFTSFGQGVQATIQTIKNGNYGDINSALASGSANPNHTYAGLGTWSGGGYTSLSGVSPTNKAVQSNSISQSGQSGTLTGGAAAAGDSVSSYADANYGYLGAFLHDPVVGPILRQAATEGWDNAKLLGALYKTPWWQHTSDTARQFDAEAKLDPAAHAQKITNQAATILSLAKQDGFALDPNRAKQLATQSLRLGWSNDQIRQGVASEYKYNPANDTNATVAALKQDAWNYAIPLSDSTIQTWATNIMGGKATANDFTAYAQTQAKSLYPTIATALDGMTTRQYYDPYAQIAGKELNLDPHSIDLSDSKWQKALMQTLPDGTRQAMTLDDWTKTLRNDPAYGWDNTPQAIKAGADVGAQLSSAMGM